MQKRSRALAWFVVGLFVTAAVEACGASDEKSGRTNGVGLGGTSGLGSMDATTVDAPSEGGEAGGGRPDYDALCGVADDGCVPDDARACASHRAGAAGAGASAGTASGGSGNVGGTGGSGNASGSSGSANTSGSAGDTSSAGEGGEGGAGGEGEGGQGHGGEGTGPSAGGEASAVSGRGGGGSGGGGSGGGAGTVPGGGIDVRYSCQVRSANETPAAACYEAGAGAVDEPCLGGSDCRPGLACVGKVAGRCRPYCCDHGACRSEGTHCSVEPLIGAQATPGEDPPSAPVCVPAIACSLVEDYPCVDGGVCTCPAGTACMVVGDGATNCLPPGDGSEGEACPCAWGHVCSDATSRCAKLCQTAAPSNDCGTGRCQSTPAMPLGWGVCVGYSPTDAG